MRLSCGLPEDVLQANDVGDGPGADNLAQHGAGADRRELVDVADGRAGRECNGSAFSTL